MREVGAHAAGVFAVVVGIFLLRRFGALLDDAADGSIPLGVLLHLLGLRTVMALPSLLPVIVYLAVVLALGRLYRDEEATALDACGVGPRGLHVPVLAFAGLAAAGVAVLSFSVRPWAAERFERVRGETLASVEMGRMSAGRFYQLDGERVVFAGGRPAEAPDHLERLFVHESSVGRIAIVLAERANEHRDADGRYRIFDLADGRRYEIDTEEGDVEITTFGRSVVRVPLGAGLETPSERGGAMGVLIGSSNLEDRAELQWRLAMPISTILLAALALPLGRVRARQGKYGRLFVAIFAYLLYRQLLGAAKNWIASGTMAPLPGLWMVHGGCLAAVLVLLAREFGWRGVVWHRPARLPGRTAIGAGPAPSSGGEVDHQ
jgi:lipopolysaccharide export system permease protein